MCLHAAKKKLVLPAFCHVLQVFDLSSESHRWIPPAGCCKFGGICSSALGIERPGRFGTMAAEGMGAESENPGVCDGVLQSYVNCLQSKMHSLPVRKAS